MLRHNITLGVSRSLVAERAIAWWHVNEYDAALDALVDLSGNGHHAVFGSSVGVDTNDPLRLIRTNENYLYLPGTNGNYVSTPDAAPLDITGDIDIRVRISLDDWMPLPAPPLPPPPPVAPAPPSVAIVSAP